jgi:hypothetical protein
VPIDEPPPYGPGHGYLTTEEDREALEMHLAQVVEEEALEWVRNNPMQESPPTPEDGPLPDEEWFQS